MLTKIIGLFALSKHEILLNSLAVWAQGNII